MVTACCIMLSVFRVAGLGAAEAAESQVSGVLFHFQLSEHRLDDCLTSCVVGSPFLGA